MTIKLTTNTLAKSLVKVDKARGEYVSNGQQNARYETYIEWLYTRETHDTGHTEERLKQTEQSLALSSSEQFWLSYLAGFDEIGRAHV